MKKILYKINENRIFSDILLLLIVTTIVSIPMFNKYADIYLDDGSQHLMRAYGTYQNIIQNGNDNIISNFANGFGYSWNLFYGPLSTYSIIIISLIFGSFNLGFKLVLSLIFFVSGFVMYRLVESITENKNTALLAGIIYITSPYFFTDIYTRHAIGEAMAFVFLPLVFFGLYNLFNTEKKHYYLIFGAVGLILSHNIMTVLTVIIAGLYCIINIKNLSSTKVKKGLLIDFIFIILITSFFWMPFLQTKFFTDYRVYEHNAMSARESFLSHSKSFRDLFSAPNDTSFIFEIGLPVILMLVFSIVTLKKIGENKKEYIFFLSLGIITALMSTKYFPWKFIPEQLLIIQFPWRMLLISTFCFSIICSINMMTIVKNFNIKDVCIILIICVIYIVSKWNVIQYNENIVDVENYQLDSVTGQNNEWLPGMGRLEYLPSKAYKNTFYIATRDDGIIKLNGECEINNYTKIGQFMSAKISTSNDNVTLELPYLYYPGYTLRFDGIIQKTFETENGFIGCNIEPNENGKLELKYTGTKVMNITKIISIISFIIFLIYVWKIH